MAKYTKEQMQNAIFAELERVVPKTVWVLKAQDGFVGVDYNGVVVASNKIKANLIYSLRQQATLAIAVVIEPNRRQPNRKLPKSRR